MTPEQVVARHEGVIRLQAQELANDRVSFDDLAQEGRFVVWEAAAARPGSNLDKLASYVSKRRMLNVLRDARMLGAEDGRRWEPSIAVWTDGLDVNSFARSRVEYRAGVAPSAEELALRVIECEKVHEAIDILPNDRYREIAQAQLNEEPAVETAERLGVSRQAVWNMWNRQVKPALFTRLELERVNE